MAESKRDRPRAEELDWDEIDWEALDRANDWVGQQMKAEQEAYGDKAGIAGSDAADALKGTMSFLRRHLGRDRRTSR